MNLKRVSTMLKVCTLAALFVVGSQAQALAAPIVNFTTTGVFGSTGTNTVTFTSGGSVQLTFTGVNASIDTFGGTINTSFGEVAYDATGTFGPGGAAADTFTLNFNQTAPSGGAGALLGSVTGTIGAFNGTDFRLLFSTTSLSIGGVTYTIQQPPGGYFIVPETSNNGITSVQGQINAVPEPTTMMLLGTGLLAAFRARRKVVS